MSDYWEELEKMEEERDAQEYAEAMAYKQGREDAIEEFYSKYREKYWFSSDFMNFFDETRKQLKEQKNDFI